MVIPFHHDMDCELGKELLCSHCSPKYFARCQIGRHSLMNLITIIITPMNIG